MGASFRLGFYTRVQSEEEEEEAEIGRYSVKPCGTNGGDMIYIRTSTIRVHF